MRNLNILQINENNISGPTPNSFANLTSIKHLERLGCGQPLRFTYPAYMSSPCHSELFLLEKEDPMKKEVRKRAKRSESRRGRILPENMGYILSHPNIQCGFSSSYDFLGNSDHIVFSYRQQGKSHLGVLDCDSGSISLLDIPFSDLSDVVAADDYFYIEGASASIPRSIAKVTLNESKTKVVNFSIAWSSSPDLVQYRPFFSTPELVEFPTSKPGQKAYAYFYPPSNPNFQGLPYEKPPLLVKTHGGPTAETRAILDLSVQYWTSRGWAYVDVNYGGSTAIDELTAFKEKPSENVLSRVSWQKEEVVKEPSVGSFRNLLLYHQACVSVDEDGDHIFISDSNHHRIIISNSNGMILDYSAKFLHPASSFYHAAEDCQFIVDSENHAVRKADLGRTLQTVYPVFNKSNGIWSWITDKLGMRKEATPTIQDFHADSMPLPWHLIRIFIRFSWEGDCFVNN
ncbi:hypothetical protein Zm00014a_014394 [Zea mays]|uniref:Uncharacterized protein n=1 Tax=Zea mays TaxID=4577 RepID=A0A3L6DRU6_MAIZE|nr:hypothetical protein Zm00014a_014394 [Zea mays]